MLGLIVYSVMMALSVIGRAEIESVAMVFVMTGAIPVLAIATVSVLAVRESGRIWPGTERGGELRILAARITVTPGRESR